MPCDHPDVTTLLKPPFPSWLQLMTWAGSSVTVTFTGSSMVAVELDGHMTAVPAADRWINQTRNDLPSVVFQASAWQGTNSFALQRCAADQRGRREVWIGLLQAARWVPENCCALPFAAQSRRQAAANVNLPRPFPNAV